MCTCRAATSTRACVLSAAPTAHDWQWPSTSLRRPRNAHLPHASPSCAALAIPLACSCCSSFAWVPAASRAPGLDKRARKTGAGGQVVVQAHGQHRRRPACRRVRAGHGSVGTGGLVRSMHRNIRLASIALGRLGLNLAGLSAAAPPLFQRHLGRAAAGVAQLGRVHQARQPR